MWVTRKILRTSLWFEFYWNNPAYQTDSRAVLAESFRRLVRSVWQVIICRAMKSTAWQARGLKDKRSSEDAHWSPFRITDACLDRLMLGANYNCALFVLPRPNSGPTRILSPFGSVVRMRRMPTVSGGMRANREAGLLGPNLLEKHPHCGLHKASLYMQ